MMMHQAMKNNPSSLGDDFSNFAFDQDELDLEIGQELQDNEKHVRTAHKHKKTPSFAEDDFKLSINPKICKTPNETNKTKSHRKTSKAENITTEFDIMK